MKPKRPRRRLNPNTVLLIRQILIGVMVVSFISLLVLSVWYGTRVNALTISEVTVAGGETIPHDVIKEKVQSALNGTYLGLIPKRFSFAYPHQSIKDSIDTIERVQRFTLTRTDFKTLAVSFTEYIPDALWCDDADSTCVFLDTTGFAFTTAPVLRGGSFLRFERVGSAPTTNVQAFSSDDYETAHTLTTILEEVGWYVSRVEVDAANDAYLSVVGGGEFKVSLKDDPVAIVDNLLTVLGATEFKHITAGNFEYIDLRFGNKVFVKEFTEEPEIEPEPLPESKPELATTDDIPEVVVSEVSSTTE